MSQQNLEIVQEQFEGVNRRDWDAVMAAVARHHGSGRASGAKVEQITANVYTRVDLADLDRDAIESFLASRGDADS